MELAPIALAALLVTGCGFRHCTEFAADRDDRTAALCEAKCRCAPSERFDRTLPKGQDD